jgi:hypothetical protein
VNSSFESARTLKKGEVEFTGHYSSYSYNSSGYDEEEASSGKLNDNLGFKVGFGISERVDVKLRYENIIPVDQEGANVQYLSLSPKVNIVKGVFAGSLGMGGYFADGESYLFLGPRFHLSKALANNQIEPAFTAKADIFPEDGTILVGINLGFALSSDLNKWALRPEFGWMTDIDATEVSYTTFGIGASIILGGK